MATTVRTMAAAVLLSGDDYLLMLRSKSRTLAPGQWSAVGGHLEGREFGNPLEGCLREIAEETGLEAHDLEELNLRYVLLRLRGFEIRHQYIYVGRVLRRNVGVTDEGELHWVPTEKVLGLDLPATARAILSHYLSAGCRDEHLRVGVVAEDTQQAGEPSVTWVELRDWEPEP